MNQRYLLCFLLGLALIIYGLPRLPLHETGLAYLFAVLWMGFALLVIGGNGAALLYKRNQTKTNAQFQSKHKREGKKVKRYVR